MIRSAALRMLLALAVFAWCSAAATARTEVLTLDKALELALQHNLKVENAGLEVGKAGDSVAAARTRRLPSFNLTVLESRDLNEESYEFKQGVFGTFPGIGPIPANNTEIETHPGFTTIVAASLEQPLLQLYRINLNIGQRETKQAITRQELRAQRQSVANDVKQMYYKLLQTQGALQAINESIVFYRELNQLLEKYLAEGTVLKSESLEAKTRLAKAEYDALTHQNDLATDKERLNHLMGRDIFVEFKVNPVPENTVYEVDLEAAQALALQQRPEIKEADLKVRHAEYERRIKQSEYIPDLSFKASYYTPFNTELLPRNVASVGLFLRWEFFDWGRKRDNLAEKYKAIKQADNEVRQTKDNVIIEVNNQYRKLQESRVRLNVARLSRETAKEKLRVAMDEYKQKAVLLKSVLQDETSLAESNRQYEDALLSFWKAKADFEKAIGEE
jgi:outer membrane protein TolC